MKKILLTLAALVLCSSAVFAENPKQAPPSGQDNSPGKFNAVNAVGQQVKPTVTPTVDNPNPVPVIVNDECCYYVSSHRCFLGFKHYRYYRYVKPVSVSSDCGCK